MVAVIQEQEKFQFTPLREGRRQVFLSHIALVIFQFTPLREGRPEVLPQFC